MNTALKTAILSIVNQYAELFDGTSIYQEHTILVGFGQWASLVLGDMNHDVILTVHKRNELDVPKPTRCSYQALREHVLDLPRLYRQTTELSAWYVSTPTLTVHNSADAYLHLDHTSASALNRVMDIGECGTLEVTLPSGTAKLERGHTGVLVTPPGVGEELGWYTNDPLHLHEFLGEFTNALYTT